MDKEERREASAAGLMVGIFILILLTTIGGFVLATLWPSPPLTSLPEVGK